MAEALRRAAGGKIPAMQSIVESSCLVGWVEALRNPPLRKNGGLRKASTHPTQEGGLRKASTHPTQEGGLRKASTHPTRSQAIQLAVSAHEKTRRDLHRVVRIHSSTKRYFAFTVSFTFMASDLMSFDLPTMWKIASFVAGASAAALSRMVIMLWSAGIFIS